MYAAQISVFDVQPEQQPLPPDDFRWLQQLQAQVDEVQEQIDATALAKEPLQKNSADYRVLQKHLNAEIERRGRMMGHHEAVAASRGHQLLIYPQVSEDGRELRYVYALEPLKNWLDTLNSLPRKG